MVTSTAQNVDIVVFLVFHSLLFFLELKHFVLKGTRNCESCGTALL